MKNNLKDNKIKNLNSNIPSNNKYMKKKEPSKQKKMNTKTSYNKAFNLPYSSKTTKNKKR